MNIFTKFTEAVAANPALEAKVLAVQEETLTGLADKLAALSVEAGTPFTAAEYREYVAKQEEGELSEEALDAVAGGRAPYYTYINPARVWKDYGGKPPSGNGQRLDPPSPDDVFQ